MRYIGGYPVTPEVEKRLKDIGLTMEELLDDAPEKNNTKTTADTYDTSEITIPEKTPNDKAKPTKETTKPVKDDAANTDNTNKDVSLSEYVESFVKKYKLKSETALWENSNIIFIIVLVMFLLIAFKLY